MTSEPTGRWWRRGRDEANTAARDAAASAAQTMVNLDATHSMFREVSNVGSISRPAGEDWALLNGRVEALIAEFLAKEDSFDRTADLPVSDAQAQQRVFNDLAARMEQERRNLDEFERRHSTALDRYRRSIREGREALRGAEGAVGRAEVTLLACEREGFTDSLAAAYLRDAKKLLAEARVAAGRQDWTGTVRASRRCVEVAGQSQANSVDLSTRFVKVQQGFASVNTRREALQTQHDRLEPVMSELRKRFVLNAYGDVESAPKRIDAALDGVTGGLATMTQLLAERVVDVAKAEACLAGVRRNASAVDAVLNETRASLDRLVAAATDPEVELKGLRREVGDVRHLVNALSPQGKTRFASTFDALARRAVTLEDRVRKGEIAARNSGQILVEVDAIAAGLKSLVSAIRSFDG